MRRARNRFYTIDAENEEEFIKEFENIKRSRLSKITFEEKQENEEDEKIQEIDEEETLSPRKKKNSIIFNEDGEYSGKVLMMMTRII